MEHVENISQRPPVIVGFGTRPQEAALRTAGAEKVFIHPTDTPLLFELKGIAIRADDTLLVAQPALLKTAEYRELYEACEGRLVFQVIGHDVFPISTPRHFTEFRKIKPRGISETEAVQFTGRPATISYTLEQADAIIRLWHEKPKRRPAEVRALAETILSLEPDTLKPHWVRDLVIKFVGTAQRDKPEGWNGVEK